ncbi:MAG TPA: BatD family protein [Candidatus Omnitrophota bacterium]|nr:BatD family protein [Candidatus Omnitrophota bacterium]
MKKTWLAFLFSLFFILDAAAQGTSIKAGVNKKALTTDDTLTYKITITSSERDALKPSLPKFEGFNILSQAQSSSISFAKNERKTTSAFIYVLSPKETGALKIEPASVKVGGQTHSSEPFEIEVTQGKLKPLPQNNLPEAEVPQITL